MGQVSLRHLSLKVAKNTPSELKFVVCNADEGDPGAYSDRYLLEQQPHAVLLGMMLAAYMISTTWRTFIHGESPESIAICEAEIKKLYEKKLLGGVSCRKQFFIRL